MIETFAVSLVVSILCAYFAHLQRDRVAEAIEAQRSHANERDLGEVPEITQQYVSQALDISYNFPAAILTLLAFWHLFPNGYVSIALLVIAVLVGLFFRQIVDPKYAPAYDRWTYRNFSLVTGLLITANAVGLGLAVLKTVYPTHGS